MSKQNEQKTIKKVTIIDEGMMVGVGFISPNGSAVRWDSLKRAEKE